MQIIIEDGRRFVVTLDSSGIAERVVERKLYGEGRPFESFYNVQCWSIVSNPRPGRGLIARVIQLAEIVIPTGEIS